MTSPAPLSAMGAALLAALLSGVAPASPTAWTFVDVAADRGLSFRHAASKTTARFLPETMGGGVALLDVDGDGRLDVLFTNGAALRPDMTSALRPDKRDPRFWNRLFRQQPDGTFVDVTAAAGVAGRGYDFGVAAGDVDNDGHVDIYVTGYGGNTLYRNRGDGTFADVTRVAGVQAGGWSSSAAFVDVDGDGHLDLFVGRYLDWTWEANVVCPAADGTGRAYCHPRLFSPIANVLYRNRGDGTFDDVSQRAGIAAHAGKALGVAIDDVDGDGHVDIFVANDSMRQFLFHNRGDGTFEEIALTAGVAYDEAGGTFAGMGTDFGDYDGDLRPDLIVTTLSLERYALYRNDGADGFTYTTHTSGVGQATARGSGWGTRLLDLDNDGDVDLFVAQGHVLDTVRVERQGYAYEQPPLLLRNDRGRFVDVSSQLGPSFGRAAAGRGAAFGDVDRDGDIDVVVSHLDGAPSLLRNDAPAARALRVRLAGVRSNRGGIGAILTLTDATTRRQRSTITSASSYQSSSEPVAHFGLGTSTASGLVVHWPSGLVQQVTPPPFGELVVREPMALRTPQPVPAPPPRSPSRRRRQ